VESRVILVIGVDVCMFEDGILRVSASTTALKP